MIFQFYMQIEAKGLTLTASIRPGRQEVRQKLFDMVQAHPKLFKTDGKLYANYTRVYSRSLLKVKALQELDVSMLQGTIAQGFEQFLQADLPRIEEVLAAETWIWAEGAPYASEGATPEDSAAIETETEEGEQNEQ